MGDTVTDIKPAGVDEKKDTRPTGDDAQQLTRAERTRQLEATRRQILAKTAAKQGAGLPKGKPQKLDWSKAGSQSRSQRAERKTEGEFPGQLTSLPLRVTLAANKSGAASTGKTGIGPANAAGNAGATRSGPVLRVADIKPGAMAQARAHTGDGADNQPQPPAIDPKDVSGDRTSLSPAIYYPETDAVRLYETDTAIDARNAYCDVPHGVTTTPHEGPAYEHTLPPSEKNQWYETYRANNWVGAAYSAGVNSPSFMALTEDQKESPASDYSDYIAKKHDLYYNKVQQQLLTDLDKGPGTYLDSIKKYYDALAESDKRLLKERKELADKWDEYEAKIAAKQNVSPPKMIVPDDGTPGDQKDQPLVIYNSDWSRFMGHLPMDYGIQYTGNAEDAARIAGYQNAIKQATRDGYVYRNLLPNDSYGNKVREYMARGENRMDARLADAYVAADFIERGLTSKKGEVPKVVGQALMDKLAKLRQTITALGGRAYWLPLSNGRFQAPVVIRNQAEADAYYADARTAEAKRKTQCN